MNNKLKIIILLVALVHISLVQAIQPSKIRIATSINTFGIASYSDFDGSASANFPLGFSFGIESEKTKTDTTRVGLGFSLILPTKLENKKSVWPDYKKKLQLKGNLAIYRYLKGTASFGNNCCGFIKINYGSGLPYFLYLALGFGFEIERCWNLEVIYNYHLATVFWKSISIKYVSINLGYSFSK